MAGSRKSILMLKNTGKLYNVVGDKIRADSYFGMTDGLHTVQASFKNFTGGFGIQGTLSLNPTDSDWFWIELKQIKDFDQSPFIALPINPLSPTGNAGTGVTHVGDTREMAWTFSGNFTYLRAVVIRDYLNYTSADQYITDTGNIINSSRLKSKDGLMYTEANGLFNNITWSFGAVDRVLLCL